MHRVAIHSVPRSGSSWLGQIFNSSPQVLYKYQPLFSYELKGYLDAHSSPATIDAFFEELATTESPFLDQCEAIEQGIVPEFRKSGITHVAYKEVRYHHIVENLVRNGRDIRVIGLIRNPLSVLQSWFNAPREFRKDLGWQEKHEWREALSKNHGRPEEYYGYARWKEVAVLFLRLELQYPSRFKLAHYYDLITNVHNAVTELFEFCGLEFTAQTWSFLNASRSINQEETYSVFKARRSDDTWKSLNRDIITEVVADLRDTPLSQFLPPALKLHE